MKPRLAVPLIARVWPEGSEMVPGPLMLTPPVQFMPPLRVSVSPVVTLMAPPEKFTRPLVVTVPKFAVAPTRFS